MLYALLMKVLYYRKATYMSCPDLLARSSVVVY